jgi:putative zinc finger/helix-turn-helix YgiT family protein
MKRCTKCGKSELVKGLQPIEVGVGATVFEDETPGWRCRSCGEVYYQGNALARSEWLAATWLVAKGFETGAELRFLRKVAGLRATDLAKLLGVSAETVSHWETGKHPIDVATRNAVADLAIDAAQRTKRARARERLLALASPPHTRPKRVNLRRKRAA